MSLQKAIDLLRAEDQFISAMAKLFTKPHGYGAHEVKLPINDPDCMHLASISLLEWHPVVGAWFFTKLGNEWLKQRIAAP